MVFSNRRVHEAASSCPTDDGFRITFSADPILALIYPRKLAVLWIAAVEFGCSISAACWMSALVRFTNTVESS